jgi:DNA-directed RNA polymerase subunit RPC12/RpoP
MSDTLREKVAKLLDDWLIRGTQRRPSSITDAILALFEQERVEWAEGSDGEWTCSGCGRDWYIEAETPEANEYLHCPGCGKPIATYKPYSFDDDDDAAAKEETP